MLERRVAVIRLIEALRLHAGGTVALPKSFEDVKIVRIPPDPVSGKPFDCHLEGDTSTVVDALAKGQGPLGLTYRITLRK
jgi:hypothetical protein